MNFERTYPQLEAPIPNPINGMDRRSATAYLRWYLENRDQRVQVLLDHLGVGRATTITELESALRLAGRWLLDHASKEPLERGLVEDRRKQVGARLSSVIPSDELSGETVAFCYDMAALLGKIFQLVLPGFDYEVRLGNKRNIDYGHVVLSKQGKVDINPYRLCTVLAYEALENTLDDEEITRMLKCNVEIRS